MFRKHSTFNFCYSLILLLNVYALAIHSQLLKMIGMPLVGFSLILYLVVKTKLQEGFHRFILIGLVLSLAGDIQLLFTSGIGFYLLTALIASLISYLFYARAYFQDFKNDLRKSKRIGNILIGVAALIGLSFYLSARKNLQEFNYPVIAYVIASLIMIMFAAYRYRRVNQTSFKLILTSTIAFSISDLTIGYYNFIEPEIIMMHIYLVTYLIAQYLVVMGTIERRLIRNVS